MRKDVLICDICEITIASKKCELCGKDICEECNHDKFIGYITYEICSKCDEKFQSIATNDPDFLLQIFKEKIELKKEVINILKNAFMLYNLEDKKPKPASIPLPLKYYTNNKKFWRI
jgi:hypothetical protein